MSTVVNVAIHQSQFPDAVRRDLLDSFRTRRVNHKFHYDTPKQTLKWLALHQAHSPSRNDADCVATYDQAFTAAADRIATPGVHLAGLGCGGGQKDTRLLRLLHERGRKVSYMPCDVSVAMVLVAHRMATSVVAEEKCLPLVCDLATAGGLPEEILAHDPLSRCGGARAGTEAVRLVTFFGMIPNFEPEDILPKLGSLVRPGDWLLFSANLAPGSDYAAGVQRVLPQYDNALTRDWLLTFLLDAGVERGDGQLRFSVESAMGQGGLQKIAVHFHFVQARAIEIEGERFVFKPGESVQLFFSYRYTPAQVRSALAAHGLEVLDLWITKSGEEGVFLVQRR